MNEERIKKLKRIHRDLLTETDELRRYMIATKGCFNKEKEGNIQQLWVNLMRNYEWMESYIYAYNRTIFEKRNPKDIDEDCATDD